MLKSTTSVVRTLMLTLATPALPGCLFAQSGPVITGQAAFTDYTQEHPGVRRKIGADRRDLAAAEPDVRYRIEMLRRVDDPPALEDEINGHCSSCSGAFAQPPLSRYYNLAYILKAGHVVDAVRQRGEWCVAPVLTRTSRISAQNLPARQAHEDPAWIEEHS